MAKIYDGECPCKDCDKKGCGTYHSACEKYTKWKASGIEKEKEHYINIRRYKRKDTKVWKRWGIDNDAL